MSLVYFIVNEKRQSVKIGHAREPLRRLSILQIGSVDGLHLKAVLEGGRELERELHERFASLRQRGEWFDLVGGLLDYVSGLEPFADSAKKFVPMPPPPIDEDAIIACHPDEVRAGVRAGLPKAAIARAAGCHENTLKDIELETWNPRWDTLRKLCAAVEAVRLQQAERA